MQPCRRPTLFAGCELGLYPAPASDLLGPGLYSAATRKGCAGPVCERRHWVRNKPAVGAAAVSPQGKHAVAPAAGGGGADQRAILPQGGLRDLPRHPARVMLAFKAGITRAGCSGPGSPFSRRGSSRCDNTPKLAVNFLAGVDGFAEGQIGPLVSSDEFSEGQVGPIVLQCRSSAPQCRFSAP
jgi:hypothetical protein